MMELDVGNVGEVGFEWAATGLDDDVNCFSALYDLFFSAKDVEGPNE